MTNEEAIQVLESMKSEESYNALIDLCNMAIEALSAEAATLNHEKVRITDTDSVEKVQSEQVTSKLKNPCDSLLTDDKDDSKEQKSKLDLISRAEAIEAVESAYKEPLPISMAYPLADIVGILKALPSADRPTLKQTDTLIIADALRYLTEDEERHEIDRARAEKLREQVLAYGASMCPSADRPSGEWQNAYRKTANGVDFRVIECNKCGFADAQMNYYHYCPNCGARMGNDDDDLDGLKIIAIIDGEGGSE